MAYATETRASQGGLAQRVSEFRAVIADRFAKYKLYRQTLNELADLSDRDLADLGIHRGLIGSLAREAAYGK